jgi:uncharacterized oligopeptide transporter (OPT) family protein
MWLMLTFNPIAGARTSGFENVVASLFVVIFGFLFVTVSSRICGLIGTSANPVSGMTIATLMATCAMFLAMGWTAPAYSALAITIGGVVCVAAANAVATSQDLKTGFLIGATPSPGVVLMISVMVSVFADRRNVMLMNRLSEFRRCNGRRSRQGPREQGCVAHPCGSERSWTIQRKPTVTRYITT